MRIDSPISLNAIITGSFTGSFKGDGSQLTGITAEWDGSHTGNASIDGDLTVSNLITAGNVDGVDVSDLKSSFDTDSAKLAGIEAGATGDQTGAEIKALYEAEADTNAFDDAAVSKLAGIEAGATGDQTAAEILIALKTVDGANSGLDADLLDGQSSAYYATQGEVTQNTSDIAANTSKLSGIEAGATGDQSAAEIKTAYESNANTNVFDDAAVSKLAGLEAGAEVNVVTSVASKTGDVSLVKGDVGLGSVDNTSDADKPISTATQTALNNKAPLASPTFTGTVIAPTQTGTDDSTKVATTAFVQGRIDAIIGTAGTTLDTLGELSASLAADQSGLAALTISVGGKLQKDQNLSDLTNVGTARTNLGLGSAATTNSTAYATAAQGTKADTAHGWGDHSLVGYLTSYVDTNTTYSAGTGLGLSGTTFSHSDTSTQTSVNNSGRTYIQDITLDGFGHVTGISSATETVVNTDTNTTYTAGTGLGLSGTTFSHSDTSTQGSVNNSGRTYIQDITLDGFGHVTGIASATETVVNTDTNTTYSAGTGVTLSGTTFSIGQAVATNSNVSFASVTATGNITAYSDASLKKDVKTIEGALDKTKALRGVEFTRIADDAKSIGVIAQELETVLPELVVTDDKGIKAVNYAQITGLLIEAVKELSAKVDELSK